MKFKNVFIIIFLIIQFSNVCSLIIPLYPSKYTFKNYSILEFIDSFSHNFKYTYVEMGNPPQRFPIIFKTKDSENSIKGDNIFPDSFYNLNFSKTIQYYHDKRDENYLYLKDIITFDKDHKNLMVNFYYDKVTMTENNVYGVIGLGYIMPNEEENNFFYQLKEMKAIDKNIFYFNYTNDNQIFLNIGSEPYEKDNSFSANASKIIVDPILDYEVKTGKIRKYDWNLNFSRIFYFRKIPLKKEIDPYVEISRMKVRKVNFFQALIVPEEDLIKGPFEYMENLDNDFFDKLIFDNICQRKIFENRYYYYCKKEHESLIKNTFAPLYFYHPELNYIFELKYEDVWFKKGEFLFFGIYFERFLTEVFKGAFISEWGFGKLFLKKYCFAFDFENNQLLFYKKNKIEKKKKENNNLDENNSNSNKKIYQLGLILVVITIGVFAFLLDRFARRKYKVNNLLIDYENPKV